MKTLAPPAQPDLPSRRFRPGLWPTLAAALGIALFVQLGLWQYGKGQARLAQQAEQEAAMKAAPFPLTALPAERLRFRPVLASGRYESTRQILLDNEVHRGQAGYRVLTPFRLEDGDHLLVDRGWVPLPRDRGLIPKLDAPAGHLILRGIAAPPPSRRLELAPPPDAWRPVWESFDMARYERLAGLRLHPLVLRLDPAEPGGYVREWPGPGERANRNLSYAMQWFGMAAALLGFWTYSGWRRGRTP